MKITKILFVPVLMALAAGASAGVAMKLAPEISATPPMPVTGRDSGNPLAFGPWHVSMPAPYQANGWQSSGMLPRFVRDNAELAVNAERAWLEFEVVADAPGNRPASADCLAQGRFASLTEFHERSEDETSVTFPGFPRLDCEFTGVDSGTLMLRADFATQIDYGNARFGANVWHLRSVNTHSKQKSNFPLKRFGYEILIGERVVAAAETYGPGRVWMLPELTSGQQEQVAMIAAALLYYGTLLEQQDA